jgi:hypothetical protein
MALPLTRNTSYASKSQIKSADLNDLQDQIIALHGKLVIGSIASDAHVNGDIIADGNFYTNGEETIVVPAVEGLPSPTAPPTLVSAASWASLMGGASFVYFPLRLLAGQRLKRLKLWILEANSGGEEISASVAEMAGATGSKSTLAGGPKSSGTSGAAATIEWDEEDTDFPLEIEAGKNYFVEVSLAATSGASESRVYGIEMVVDKPVP